MTKNKYIVLNPINSRLSAGGIAVLSPENGNTRIYVSLFGIENNNFKILVDDLVFVRQFETNNRIGQFEIEKSIDDINDVVIGVFCGDCLVFVGSNIGVINSQQKERLEIALESKYSLKHFGKLTKSAICKLQNQTFFDETAFVLLDLFAFGVPDVCLQNIVPNSRWVKVFLEKDVVAVGVVEQNGFVSAVGLAYPVISKQQKREEVDSAFCFCPLSAQSPNGFGYYIVLQSAKDGSVVPLNA